MQQIVIFSLLIGSVFAAPQHLIAAPLAAPAVAVHHPAVINTHLAPAAAVVQTPTLSGYSFTSEVRHAAPLIAAAAPIVAAHAPLIAHHAPVLAAPAPVVAAAPVVHAAAPVVHAAAPVVHAAAPLLAPAAAVKTYSVETGHIVSGTSVAYAPGYATVAHAPLIAGTAVAHAPLVAPALAAPVVHAAAPVVHAAAPLFAHLKAKA